MRCMQDYPTKDDSSSERQLALSLAVSNTTSQTSGASIYLSKESQVAFTETTKAVKLLTHSVYRISDIDSTPCGTFVDDHNGYARTIACSSNQFTPLSYKKFLCLLAHLHDYCPTYSNAQVRRACTQGNLETVLPMESKSFTVEDNVCTLLFSVVPISCTGTPPLGQYIPHVIWNIQSSSISKILYCSDDIQSEVMEDVTSDDEGCEEEGGEGSSRARGGDRRSDGLRCCCFENIS